MIGEVILEVEVARLAKRVAELERAVATVATVAPAGDAARGLPLPERLRFADIRARVATEFDVPADALTGPLRSGWLIVPRFVAQWLVRHATSYSLPATGRLFGRDHTSILHAVRSIERRRAADPAFAAVTDRLLAEVRAAQASGQYRSPA